MKASALLLLAAPVVEAREASPVSKVVQLLSDLQAKVISEGAAAQKAYTEFAEWCEERSKDLGYSIETGKSEKGELEATISKETSTIGSLNAKLEELSSAIATDEADLKAATEIRHKEGSDFAAAETELTEVVSMLERAVAILEREMAKGGASMMQLKNAGNIAQALTIMVQASVMSSADASRLTALVQSSQAAQSDDNDDGFGAPDAAVYQGHSGDIISTLQNLLDKAEGQLAEARKKETTDLHNFQMLEQSLKDEIKFANKDMDEAKKALASSSEAKANAQGALDVTTKDLASDTTALSELHQQCLTKSQDHEAAVKSRDEELKALAEAKRVISESTGGADSVQYGLSQVSFIQFTSLSNSKISTSTDLAKLEAVRYIWDLAQKESSPALAQLARRMSSMMSSSSNSGQDPFAKVKGLITDMISRLESEADADASHKAYCDKELSETNEKKADKDGEIQKLTTAIDQASAQSAKLKEEVADLQKALAELASAQAEMTKIRGEEKAVFEKSKADMVQGLEGVKLGLKILREYYAKGDKAHEAAEGAGQGIIGLLEVVESDFSKTLAEITTAEENAAQAYDQATKANAIEKASKEQDVKYKQKSAASLAKKVTEATSDRSGVQAELDAVMEYLASLHKQCDPAKPDSYAVRKGRREAEIAGLKEALTILEGESVLLQSESKKSLRGVHRH